MPLFVIVAFRTANRKVELVAGRGGGGQFTAQGGHLLKQPTIKLACPVCGKVPSVRVSPCS